MTPTKRVVPAEDRLFPSKEERLRRLSDRRSLTEAERVNSFIAESFEQIKEG